MQPLGRRWWPQKRTSSTISININKKMHRFVIGPKGSNIQEILKATGMSGSAGRPHADGLWTPTPALRTPRSVSPRDPAANAVQGCLIEVPQQSDPSDAIAVVGDSANIAKAIQMVIDMVRVHAIGVARVPAAAFASKPVDHRA